MIILLMFNTNFLISLIIFFACNIVFMENILPATNSESRMEISKDGTMFIAENPVIGSDVD